MTAISVEANTTTSTAVQAPNKAREALSVRGTCVMPCVTIYCKLRVALSAAVPHPQIFVVSCE